MKKHKLENNKTHYIKTKKVVVRAMRREAENEIEALSRSTKNFFRLENDQKREKRCLK